MRITKVTTKTGDAGKTGLGTGQRVQKDHPRIIVLGELDHLNSIIGWAISACGNKELAKPLKNIQQIFLILVLICRCQSEMLIY